MRSLRPASRPSASPPPSSSNNNGNTNGNNNGKTNTSSAGAVRLIVRVYSGEELSHSSSQGAYCKLYLGDAPMVDGSGSGRKSFEKKGSDELSAGATSPRLSGGDDLLGLGLGTSRDSVGGDADVDGVRVFRTKVQHQQPNKLAPPETIWNESFEVPMPAGDAPAILSVRVKSHHLLYCPVIGACAISLLSLRVGERLDQFFPLHRGKKPAGRLRLMLHLVADDGRRRSGQGSKGNIANNNNNNAAHPDILAARAANREADDAIKRLLENRVKEDEQRRQRKLERRESRREEQRQQKQQPHPVEVGPPVFETRSHRWEDAPALVARKLDDVVHRGPKKKATPPSEPAVLPPLGTPAAIMSQQSEQLSQQLKTQLQLQGDQDQDEREKRIDRKLRRLARERARLQSLKQQLKKYIPDLSTDSDSDSGASDASSTLSSGSERRTERPRKP